MFVQEPKFPKEQNKYICFCDVVLTWTHPVVAWFSKGKHDLVVHCLKGELRSEVCAGENESTSVEPWFDFI